MAASCKGRNRAVMRSGSVDFCAFMFQGTVKRTNTTRMKHQSRVPQSPGNTECSPTCPPELQPVCQPPDHPETSINRYQFRYDDGYSAQIGAVRIPLFLGQPSRDGEFIFRHPPCPLEKPLRVLPEDPVPWWPATSIKRQDIIQEAARPRYRGLTVDFTRCPPNETIVKYF